MTAGPLTRTYWPALDGLRGLAILLVVLAHSGIGLKPVGGQVGVTLFFVLSGFLITSILVAEKSGTNGINLRHFYGRRARRLLPALVFFFAGSGITLWLMLDGYPIWQSTWPGLFYASNYAQVAGVDVIANTHLWSLSVEEHFYALWPIILLRIKGIPSATTLLKVAVAMICLRFAVGLFDPNWAYHGTLTNSYALLLGCAVAVGSSRLQRKEYPRWIAGAGVLVLVLLSLWPTETVSERLATGIWLPVVVAAVSALLVVVLIEGSHFVFEMGWLRYMGRISYGWYLWHAPFLFIAALNNTPEKRLASAVGTFAIAAFSWHVVEKRFLRHRQTGSSQPDAERTGVR